MRLWRTQAHEKELPRVVVLVGVGIGIAFAIEIAIGRHFDIDSDSEPDTDSDPEIPSEHSIFGTVTPMRRTQAAAQRGYPATQAGNLMACAVPAGFCNAPDFRGHRTGAAV